MLDAALDSEQEQPIGRAKSATASGCKPDGRRDDTRWHAPRLAPAGRRTDSCPRQRQKRCPSPRISTPSRSKRTGSLWSGPPRSLLITSRDVLNQFPDQWVALLHSSDGRTVVGAKNLEELNMEIIRCNLPRNQIVRPVHGYATTHLDPVAWSRGSPWELWRIGASTDCGSRAIATPVQGCADLFHRRYWSRPKPAFRIGDAITKLGVDYHSLRCPTTCYGVALDLRGPLVTYPEEARLVFGANDDEWRAFEIEIGIAEHKRRRGRSGQDENARLQRFGNALRCRDIDP